MKDIIKFDFDGTPQSFNKSGWFNATEAAARFGKRPVDWLRLPDTQRYIEALCEISEVRKSHFIRTLRGASGERRGGATWLHPKLAVQFSRWLDIKFSIWCDEQIDGLIRGDIDWKRLRHEATSSFKVMNEILRQSRNDSGKPCQIHHFSNEARLINWALTGKFGGIDRDTLSNIDLDLLARLEERNAVLIGRSVEYADRKKMLEQAMLDLRASQALVKAS